MKKSSKPSPSVAKSRASILSVVNLSYAKHNGEKPFNWNRFLKQKQYTQESLDAAVKRSGNWVTCACGQQCVIIDRYTREDELDNSATNRWAGQPKDKELDRLGMKFFHDICALNRSPINENQRAALKTLGLIEKRSAVLIKAKLKELEREVNQ